MRRRGIGEEIMRTVFAAPEQRYPVRQGRDVLRSRTAFAGGAYLVLELRP
jgi:hypothetical protein